jgi:hypothetical protein
MGYLRSWGINVVLKWPSGGPGAGQCPAPGPPGGHSTIVITPRTQVPCLRYPMLCYDNAEHVRSCGAKLGLARPRPGGPRRVPSTSGSTAAGTKAIGSVPEPYENIRRVSLPPDLAPTSYQYIRKLICRDPDINGFGSLDGPGAPGTTPKSGARSAPPFGVVWGPRGHPDLKNILFLGPGTIGFHDVINTKLRSVSSRQDRPRSVQGPRVSLDVDGFPSLSYCCLPLF